jgi:hypothetical protein
MVTAEKQHAGTRRPGRVVLNERAFDEQQTIARGLIRRMLVQFHREWTDLAEKEGGAARVLATNALLDRYSHQLYDCICDMEATLGEDLAVEIRCLSADMIKTANVLVMIGYGEERREHSEALAKEALHHAERCLALVEKGGSGLTARVIAIHREE